MGTPWNRGPVHIYVLRAPDSPEVRYVGATCRPVARLAAHRWTGANNCAPRLREWIDGLRARGLRPVMDTLEIWHDAEEARAAERFAIERLSSAGNSLLNQDMIHARPRQRGQVLCDGPTQLRAWMERAGMTQFELSRELGVKQGAVSFWLCFQRTPKLDMAMRIERVTGVPVTAWSASVEGA